MKNHWNAVNSFLKIHLNNIKKQIKALNTAFNQFNIFHFSNWIDKGNKNHMNTAYGNQHLRKLCNNLLLNVNRICKQEKCRSFKGNPLFDILTHTFFNFIATLIAKSLRFFHKANADSTNSSAKAHLNLKRKCKKKKKIAKGYENMLT